MIGKPPPRPPGVARKLDAVELRMANLRRELEAESDPSIRAAILHHMGSLVEHELGLVEDALGHYTQAHEVAPEFQPAAIARMRVLERLGPAEDVRALCADRVTSSPEAESRATALVDLALRSEQWAELLREAIAEAREPVIPALILEWLADAEKDPEALRDALRAQATHASNPALRGALWLDLALTEIDLGEIDASLEALELAAECDELAWQARALQRRTAREHGRIDRWITASTSMASLLEDESVLDPLALPVAADERLPLAALLWEESAALAAELGEPDLAAQYQHAALRHFPEDGALRLQSLFLAEHSGNHEAMARARDWFVDVAPDHPAFIASEVRQAVPRGGEQSALDVLRNIAERHPSSEYAQAALDVALLRTKAADEWSRRLRARAEASEGPARAHLLWRAARAAASTGPGSGEAQSLYAEAARASEHSRTAILRDALGTAIADGDAASVQARCEQMLDEDLDPEERALLQLCRYELNRHVLEDGVASERLLVEAISDRSCAGWAPRVARALAALSGDAELLATAHEALASMADGELAVQHLCAAGSAHARRGDWDSAERALREALGRAPADQYVVRALEDLLHAAGRPGDIVTLAQTRAEAPESRLGERSLLLAGAEAEREGDWTAARRAYEQVLAQAPESASAALALADLSRKQREDGALANAYERLARSELGGGAPELFALLRADAEVGDRGPSLESSTWYERALGHPETALCGSVALASTPIAGASDDQRAAADEILADADAYTAHSEIGFEGALGTLCGAPRRQGSSKGDAWLQLSSFAPDDRLRASALLHGLREMRVTRGESVVDELFLLAQQSSELAAEHVDAAIAIDEMIAPGDDPELRSAAAKRAFRNSTSLARGALDAAHCRALVEAERGADAVALLSAAVDQRPDDLALWETLRIAARQAGEWALVAQACERLAPFVDGALKADLLEEAGAVRLDCLEQYQQAEDLFRATLEIDPTRDVAFRRLHDLLTEREDAAGLEELVSGRLAIGGPKDRPDLLYERARLLRGFSDRPGALEVLDELFASEPRHSGALALAVEVHVSLEQWEEAVDCLRRLSQSQIPDEQRRVAHLGAADFLQTKLRRDEEALVELRAIEALGLADAETWVRIGAIEEAHGDLEAAGRAYAEALTADPTESTAVARLAELSQEPERDAMLERYERACWERIDSGLLDDHLLEELRKVAVWRHHRERAGALAEVQSELDPTVDALRQPVQLGHVSMAAIWEVDASSVIEDGLRLAGPDLAGRRVRAKKLTPNEPVYAELERLSERFGARLGSVAESQSVIGVSAYPDRNGELHWVIATKKRGGLDAEGRFEAGRLAWAAPRGAGTLVDQAPDKAAGTLAGVFTAARVPLAAGDQVLPAVAVKLRRSARRGVSEVVGDAVLEPSELVAAAHRIHRASDRAGLLASADIAAALRAICNGSPTMTAVRSSPRAIALLRFWMASDSPLWRTDG